MRVALDGDAHAALAEADAWGLDVVLLDLGLPGRDGHQAACARSAPARALAGTALVAVTGRTARTATAAARPAPGSTTTWSSPSISGARALALVEGPGPTGG